jgi:hypothetical protein
LNSTKDVKKGYSEFLIFNTDVFFVDGMTSEKLRKLLDETSLNKWALLSFGSGDIKERY